MDSLAILSEKIVPDFAMDAISNPYTDALYDISEHNVWRKRAIADAGKLIGWNARGLIQEDTLEYYILHRQLLFEQFQIELRNSILATLNDGLKRAGRLVGFDAQICIKGLPTLGDVATARAELLAGSKPFKEILQPFQKI